MPSLPRSKHVKAKEAESRMCLPEKAGDSAQMWEWQVSKRCQIINATALKAHCVSFPVRDPVILGRAVAGGGNANTHRACSRSIMSVIIPPSGTHRREFRHIQATQKEVFYFLLVTMTAERAGPPLTEVHQSPTLACAFILWKTSCLYALAVSARKPPDAYLAELPRCTCRHRKFTICSESKKQTVILEHVQILLAEGRMCEISYFNWNLSFPTRSKTALK